MPASTHTVSLFIVYLHQRGLQYSTITNYVAGIATLHNQNDYPSPDLNNFVIRDALAGVKRQKFKRPRKRIPITIQHLTDLYQKLSVVPRFLRATFWSAYLTAFFSLFRSANLFCNGGNHYLRRRGLTFTNTGFTLTVFPLKSNRFKGTLFTVPVYRSRSSHLCPVKAMQRMLSKISVSPEDPLFSYRKNGCLYYLSPGLFNKTLKQVGESAGISSDCLSTHSFRRGGATFAASAGVTTEQLKSQGNWRSDCFMRYVDRGTDLREAFAAAVQQ